MHQEEHTTLKAPHLDGFTPLSNKNGQVTISVKKFLKKKKKTSLFHLAVLAVRATAITLYINHQP